MSEAAAADELVSVLATRPAPDAARAFLELPDVVGSFGSLAEHVEGIGIRDLSRALTLVEALVAAADHMDLGIVRARARRARAQVLAYANRFQDALESLSAAVSLAIGAGATVEAALSQMTTLHALARLGRLEEALEAGGQARAAFAAAGEPVLCARADINLGVVNRMKDRPAVAIEHFARARPAVASHPVLAAQLENNAAEALLDLNRFDEAWAAFQAALAFFRSAGVTRAAAIVEGNLADFASRRGELQAALHHFESARRQFGTQAPGDVARLTAEEAEALANAGMFEQGLLNYESAIASLDRHEMAREAARARIGLGRTLIALGRLDDAMPPLEHARAACRRMENHAGEAQALAALAEVAMAKGGTARAMVLLTEALARVQDRPADRAAIQLLHARAAMDQGDLAGATAELGAALDVARALRLPHLTVAVLAARARVSMRRATPQEAISDLEQALVELEHVRGSLSSSLLRGAYLAARVGVFNDLVTLLLDLGPDRAAQTLEVAEHARSRALLDLLETGRVSKPGGRAASEKERERDRLIGDLNALYARLSQPGGVPSAALPDWRAAVEGTEHSIRLVESQLAATSRFQDVLAAPPTAAEVLALLPADTVLLEYVEDGEALSLIVVGGGSIRVSRRICTLAEARRVVGSLYFQINRALARGMGEGSIARRLTEDAAAACSDLRKCLLESVEARVERAGQLVVVPHGFLHAVPFGALSDRPTYQVPSAGVLRSIMRRPFRRGGPPLVVGVADEAAPQISREAQLVHAALPGSTLLLGEDATIEAVRRHAGCAPLVHIAAHGRFSPNDPLSSGVRLADGWLTSRDFEGMDLAGAVVVLSGCATGQAAIDAANESMGLIRGVLAGGARAAIMSLWPVHDATTIDLMVLLAPRLYSDTESPEGLPATALAAAMAQVRTGRHAAGWAPFICVGAP